MTGAPMQNQPDSDRDWFEDFLKRWANPKRIYRGWWIVLGGIPADPLGGFIAAGDRFLALHGVVSP